MIRPPEMLIGGQFNATPPTLQDGQPGVLEMSGGGDLVIANRIEVFSSSFTRPNDTAVYAHGDLVANSTSAGSVVLPSFVLPDPTIQAVRVGWCHLFISGNQAGGAGFGASGLIAYLFAGPNQPTFTNGDNGAFDPATGLNQIVASWPVTCSGFTGGAIATNDIFYTTAGLDVDQADPLTFWWALQVDFSSTPTPLASQTFTMQFALEMCR